ncbi:nucleotide exchange factor GrpE [Rhizobium sp. PL01]|uniref:nucleotide exchange factor GrpE n=1 Tax=Rhizobium sp. PL01 TaxID=3085631 RepID=UPI0029817FBF|nr:nucleotide exchange factor GrpE [Rhizobium sp. PL01]MDW5317497.1 nucleotide exchange factor GrpE [Rhizobium sp. PL01]
MPLQDDSLEKSNTNGSAPSAAEALQADQAQLIDRLQRALADSDNLRKRLQRTAEDDKRFAISTFAVRLLMVEDSLARMLKEVDENAQNTDQSVLIAGVRATERMLREVLEKGGVHRIDALGSRFDPHLHEAITEIHDTDLASGHIAGVLEDGYMIHDRLLRPAKVSVSKS